MANCVGIITSPVEGLFSIFATTQHSTDLEKLRFGWGSCFVYRQLCKSFGPYLCLHYSFTFLVTDVSNVGILQQEISKINWDVDVAAIVNGEDPVGKNALFANTQEAVDRGAFGVPRY